jgi:hypothetical protein
MIMSETPLWDLGAKINRLNPEPLDGTSIFESRLDLENYIETNPTAYPG